MKIFKKYTITFLVIITLFLIFFFALSSMQNKGSKKLFNEKLAYESNNLSVYVVNNFGDYEVYVKDKNSNILVGSMRKLGIDTPILFLPFDTKNARYILVKIDTESPYFPAEKAADYKLDTVTLLRPLQVSSDDTLSVMANNYINNKSNFALISIPTDQVFLWDSIEGVLVRVQKADGIILDKTFTPPINIGYGVVTIGASNIDK